MKDIGYNFSADILYLQFCLTTKLYQATNEYRAGKQLIKLTEKW